MASPLCQLPWALSRGQLLGRHSPRPLTALMHALIVYLTYNDGARVHVRFVLGHKGDTATGCIRCSMCPPHVECFCANHQILKWAVWEHVCAEWCNVRNGRDATVWTTASDAAANNQQLVRCHTRSNGNLGSSVPDTNKQHIDKCTKI